MSQKITAFASTIAAIGSIVACVLLWQLITGVDQLNVNEVANQDKKAAETNGKQTSGKNAIGWQPLTVTLQTNDGNPVDGRVRVYGKTFEGGELNDRVETDSNGVADFNLWPPGQYELGYSLKDLEVSGDRKVILGPGRKSQFEILCPSGPVGTFDLDFTIQPPQDLAKIPLYYLIELKFRSIEFNNEEWDLLPRGHGPVLLIDPRGKNLGQTTYDKITDQEKSSGNSYSINYLEEIPPDFQFDQFEKIPAYRFDVEFWPCVADPEKPDPAEGERPHLVRLRSAAKQRFKEQAPEVGMTHTVTLNEESADYGGDDLWTEIRENLARFEKYEDQFVPSPEEVIDSIAE